MARKNSKHIKKKNNKKYYNKSYKKIAFVVVLILIIILIINLKSTPGKVKNENTQIILNNENITSNLQDDIIREEEKIYMSFNDIQKFLDNTIYQEDETGLIITASNKKIATIKQDEENITINGSDKKSKNILIEKNDKKYIAISELEDVYDYSFNYIDESNIVTIDNLNKKSVKAYAKKKLKIKEEMNGFSKILEIVEKGKWVVLISEENGYAKIRTPNGIIGYVKKNALDNYVTERENFEEEENDTFDVEELEYDITKKDISNFEKRSNIINLILQEAIKNDKMYVKIIYNGTDNFEFERFKIEIVPVLQECGIKINI
jgi:hypothetical protein